MWALLLYAVSLFLFVLFNEADVRCAIKRFIKSPKCYACGAATSGIFNKAEKIIGKIEARNQKKREAKGLTNQDEDEDGEVGIEIGGAPSDGEDEEEGEE
jgi:RING finger protein 113A